MMSRVLVTPPWLGDGVRGDVEDLTAVGEFGGKDFGFAGEAFLEDGGQSRLEGLLSVWERGLFRALHVATVSFCVGVEGKGI